MASFIRQLVRRQVSTLCRADGVRNDPALTTRGLADTPLDQFLPREAMRQRVGIKEYH